jgi:hypothetical protein
MTSAKALLARRKKFDREDHAERVRLAILEVDVDGLKGAVHLKDAVQSSLGQQKVTVEHVHVHSGGRAVVGSVSQSGGRDNDENRGQPHAPENAGAITFAPGTTLPSADEARRAMPVASGRR